jgi:glycyl-tRNA synthetase
MGAILAEESGEAPDVAAAIREHYQPRFAGDALPGSLAGAVVGVADRLDTLTGLFAAGAQPTGARDPFGLRRTAVGLIQILVSRAARADLAAWFAAASRSLPIPAAPEALAACLAFVTARQEALLLAEGHRYDAVAAVLAEQGSDPAGAAAAVSQLEALTLQPDWPTVFQAYARCVRILRSAGLEDTGEVDPGRLQMEAERNLNRAVDALDRPVRSVPALDSALRRLVEPITAFFDDVLVMDEDPGLRENRLALVGRIAGLARGIADLSKLEGF